MKLREATGQAYHQKMQTPLATFVPSSQDPAVSNSPSSPRSYSCDLQALLQPHSDVVSLTLSHTNADCSPEKGELVQGDLGDLGVHAQVTALLTQRAQRQLLVGARV